MHTPIPRLAAGEPITACHFNLLADALAARTLSAASPPLEITAQPNGICVNLSAPPPIEFVRLDEDIEPDDGGKQAKTLRYDADATEGPWVDAARGLARVVDPQSGTFLAGERHACWFHADSGQYLPIAVGHVHLGIADEYIAPGDSGSVSIWKVVSDTDVDSSLNVSAYDWTGHGLAAGTTVFVVQHSQSRRWYAWSRHGSASQFSLTSSQTWSAGSAARVEFDTDDQADGAGAFNHHGLVALTTSGVDQGLMEPHAGVYRVGFHLTLTIDRPDSVITDATNSTPIVVTAPDHPFSVGDHVLVEGLNGNVAANGYHVVTAITSNTFTLANSSGSGTSTGNGHATQVAAHSFLAGQGTIALRRKPAGGSFSDDAAAQLDYQFPLVVNRQNQGQILSVVSSEVLVEAIEGDQFDLYLTENGGHEDVTVRALGPFQPEVAPTIVWTYLGPGGGVP